MIFFSHQKGGSRHKGSENRKQMTWRQGLTHLLRRTRSSSTNNNVRENHQPITQNTNVDTKDMPNATFTMVHEPTVTTTTGTTTTQTSGKQSNGTSRQRQLLANSVPHNKLPHVKEDTADIKRDDCFLDVDTKWTHQKQTSPKTSE